MKANTNRGFTLIELLVVIAIIGLLATVVMTSLNSARKKGRDARRVADIDALRSALEMYYDSNSRYPTSLNDLQPTYMSVIPKDPQNNDYLYYTDTNGTTYLLKIGLEDSNHNALKSDVDNNVTIGATTVSCGDPNNDTIYCVRP